jgi:hypothetical protein
MNRCCSRALASALTSSVALFLSAAASAQTPELSSSDWRQKNRGDAIISSYGSPQHFALELRVGPYYPQVDSEFGGGATPYKTVFKDNPNKAAEDGAGTATGTQIYFGAEFDYLPLRIPYLGVFGPGAGLGIVSASAAALLKSGPDAGKPSGETTTLTILPMYVAAVLRADELMRRTGFPFVPYAKFGLGIAPWKVSGAAGVVTYVDSKTNQTVRAADTTFGLHLALGGMLSLNFIDLKSAAQLDETVGVNHVYLYGEWMDSMLNGLGSRPQMHVGASTFIGGLAFDM